MAERVKFFRCELKSCHHYSPFNINAVAAADKEKAPLEVTCDKCNAKWAVTFLNQTCCRINLLFAYSNVSGSKTLKNSQSFSKRR